MGRSDDAFGQVMGPECPEDVRGGRWDLEKPHLVKLEGTFKSLVLLHHHPM